MKITRTNENQFEVQSESGKSIELDPQIKSRDDAGMLDAGEFDAEAGRDVQSEINYIRSGREKRNYGC